MVYEISTDNFEFPPQSIDKLSKWVEKLHRHLPHMDTDLPFLHIYMRKHATKDFFDGSLFLRLPHEVLNTHFKGHFIDGALHDGFRKLFRRVRNYKGKHFVGDSEYPRKNDG